MASSMKPSSLKGALRTTWALMRPYFWSEERWPARGLLMLIVALLIGNVFIAVEWTEWNKRFFDSLKPGGSQVFFRELLVWFALLITAITLWVVEFLCTQALIIRWRRWLTERFFRVWLDGQTFYRMQIARHKTDNPDERISEDIYKFVSHTLNVSIQIFQSVLILATFAVMLWRISGSLQVPVSSDRVLVIPGYMLWVAVIYAGAGTLFAHLVGRRLVSLDFDQKRFEADFRYGLVRVRENAEPVALYQGEKMEQAELRDRFGNVITNFWDIVKQKIKLNAYTITYHHAAFLVPAAVFAPRLFAGTMTFGALMQVVSIFGQVRRSLSVFVSNYSTLADWRAVVNRLSGFAATAREVQPARVAPQSQLSIVSEGESALRLSRIAAAADEFRSVQESMVKDIDLGLASRPGLHVANLDLHLPDGRALFKGVELDVEPGERVLVSGPSGLGKSTLFRAIAGIWPYGQGLVVQPGESTMFLPQRPYMPLGTLRNAIKYPQHERSKEEEHEDAYIKEHLTEFGLGHLMNKLDETRQWSLELSLGEQQRIAFLRVILTKPKWVFLDEATSALDGPTEARVYEALRRELPGLTMVSIGHRESLEALHDRRIDLSAFAVEGAHAKAW